MTVRIKSPAVQTIGTEICRVMRAQRELTRIVRRLSPVLVDMEN